MDLKFKIALGALAVVIAFAIYQQLNPRYVETIRTETRIDSVAVDSLQKIIEYYENLPPQERDTVKVPVYIPTPIVNEDSTFTYYTGISDSTIVINVDSRINGVGYLLEQDISYILKQRIVRQVDNRITESTFITTTIERTRTKKPNAYLSGGAEFSLIGQQSSFSPKLTYTNQRQETFGIRYDILNNGIAFSYTRPIRFRLPL